MLKISCTLSLLLFVVIATAQNVGIGTNLPKARLHVVDSNVLFSATGNAISPAGNAPITGAGRRMLWYADKAAFRAGQVDNNYWDTDSIGYYSFAVGLNPRATGLYSIALGRSNYADGQSSFAAGSNNYALGTYSVGIGLSNYSSNSGSVALGHTNYATGAYSFTVGNANYATATSAIALGRFSTASGDYSVSIGKNISTNEKTGSFFFGDSDPNNKGQRVIGFDNQFAMRFNGGYYLISSDAGSDIGVRVLAGGNSWSAISDVRLKENFLPVDGEFVLNKIAKFNSVSWNYKGQDAKVFRHYGPMAQEFFAAFGKDALGTIGCDTLINQHDFLGVNLIAIQALEKRTTTLQNENDALKKKKEDLEARLLKLEELIRKNL